MQLLSMDDKKVIERLFHEVATKDGFIETIPNFLTWAAQNEMLNLEKCWKKIDEQERKS
jgi:hypothetical protein